MLYSRLHTFYLFIDYACVCVCVLVAYVCVCIVFAILRLQVCEKMCAHAPYAHRQRRIFNLMKLNCETGCGWGAKNQMGMDFNGQKI